MARTGRPPKDINWTEANKLLVMQCTDEEVASWFDTTVKTLKAACKRELKMTFSQFSAQKRAKGKISLRRALWHRATDENPKTQNIAALLFACKTMLGLREYETGHPSLTAKVDGKAEIVLKWVDEDDPGAPAPDATTEKI